MKVFEGVGARRGYTLGPAFLYEGWASVEPLFRVRMPVIVVARFFEEQVLDKIDLSRVRGIVIDRSSVLDPLWERLSETPKVSIIGARGVYRAVGNGQPIIVDSVEGRAIVDPDAATTRRYERLRGTSPPKESPHVRSVLMSLTDPIRQAWMRGGWRPPYDLAEQRQLYDIAKRTAEGGLPTPEDDALVQKILFEYSQVPKERRSRW